MATVLYQDGYCSVVLEMGLEGYYAGRGRVESHSFLPKSSVYFLCDLNLPGIGFLICKMSWLDEVISKVSSISQVLRY